jgi:hypothetical protein
MILSWISPCLLGAEWLSLRTTPALLRTGTADRFSTLADFGNNRAGLEATLASLHALVAENPVGLAGLQVEQTEQRATSGCGAVTAPNKQRPQGDLQLDFCRLFSTLGVSFATS